MLVHGDGGVWQRKTRVTKIFILLAVSCCLLLLPVLVLHGLVRRWCCRWVLYCWVLLSLLEGYCCCLLLVVRGG